MQKDQWVIAVVIHGFVFTGKLAADYDHQRETTLLDAGCIRVWGTTAGLGQLAISGKQAGTTIDHCGICVIPPHSLVSLIPCTTPLR